MMRARQALLLIRPLLRTLPLAPLAAAGACGLLVVHLEGDLLLRLRAAAVALCLGAAFALDDPAAQTTAAAPTPLLFRRLLRLALVLTFVAVLWASLIAYADDAPRALALELAAMLAFGLAASALAFRFAPDGRGGLAGGSALLVFLAAAGLALPDRWTLFASAPGDPGWTTSHGRWALVLAFGLLVLVHASLDPGRRRLLPPLLARDGEPARGVDATERA
jgi:hypothetical protein